MIAEGTRKYTFIKNRMEMQTKILSPTARNIALCAREIATGGVVAFPTETVYGLGANAFAAQAVQKIFEVKGRPPDNPLIVHVADFAQIDGLAASVPERARKLMEHFMPGPLTLVLNKSHAVPGVVTAGLDTVAVRMPSDKTALAFIQKCGAPLAAPSANRSGFPSPTTARHTLEDLSGKIPYILDGGACRIGVESTVVDARSAIPVILRAGAVSAEEIEKLLGAAEIAGTGVAETETPLSPGQKYRHYAPKAEVTASAYNELMHQRITEAFDNAVSTGKNPVIICMDKRIALYGNRSKYIAGANAADYARNLYALLRMADADGFDTVFAEGVPAAGIGAAVMNRLGKAGKGLVFL